MLRRLLVALAALVALWLVACAFLFVWPRTSTPSRADAVVVLSGEKRRLPRALELIRAHVAPVLVISSPTRERRNPLPEELCRAGRYDGARVLCFLARPYSTVGEARAVSRLAGEHRWRSVVVVTSTFHVTRARMLFRRGWTGRLSFVGASSPWWRLPYEWVSETGKLLVQLTVERGC